MKSFSDYLEIIQEGYSFSEVGKINAAITKLEKLDDLVTKAKAEKNPQAKKQREEAVKVQYERIYPLAMKFLNSENKDFQKQSEFDALPRSIFNLLSGLRNIMEDEDLEDLEAVQRRDDEKEGMLKIKGKSVFEAEKLIAELEGKDDIDLAGILDGMRKGLIPIIKKEIKKLQEQLKYASAGGKTIEVKIKKLKARLEELQEK